LSMSSIWYNEQVLLERLDPPPLEPLSERRPPDVRRRVAERPDRAELTLRAECLERDATVVLGALEWAIYGYRFSQAVGEHPEPSDANRVEALQHLVRDTAVDRGVLEGVAVDQHGRLQRLEIICAQRVEHSRSDPSEIYLPFGDTAYDLLFRVREGVSPLVDHLDSKVAARELLDPRREVGDRRREIEVGVGVRHRQDDTLVRAVDALRRGWRARCCSARAFGPGSGIRTARGEDR
jgi:hypothetical protein